MKIEVLIDSDAFIAWLRPGDLFNHHAQEVFKPRTTKGTSMVDCANAVVAKRLGISQVFSFDRFYKHLGLSAPG